MNDRDLVFEVSREGKKIRIGFCERSEGGERTLRPYEERDAAWEQIEGTSGEIISLLNRANKRARVTQDILQGLKKSGQLLFDLLITPQAREKINTTTVKNLIFYLDDQLVQIPWELLYNGREFLCRKFAVGRIVSTRQPLATRASRDLTMPFKVLVLVDPSGDLEAAYREGTEIRDFLDGQGGKFHVDLKSHPTDVRFVKTNIRDYDIVHYAGHADYRSQNPCESGWLLTDGKLRASEICSMGGLQPMPLLVFSNACRSGQTDEWHIQEGCEQQIFGLANAYLLSGVQHYIGTFWEILDEPRSYFAKRFYGFLARGESVGEAVRRAREALIDAYGEETIVWASYMLYGDPTFVLTSQEQAVRVAEPTSQAPRVEWNQVVRREAGNQLQKTRPERIPLYFYPLVGLLVLASFLVGYYQLGPSSIRAAIKQVGIGSPVLAPLVLSMDVIGQRREADGSYTEILVSEGSILRSRDHFQVHLETSRPAYAYILLYDSQGKASQLFPDPKIPQPGFIEGRRKIAVPAPDLWFWLDDHPDTETIYVLASEKPLADIQGLLGKMESLDEAKQKQASQEIQERIALVQRGLGGITKGKATSYKLSDGKQIHAELKEDDPLSSAILLANEGKEDGRLEVREIFQMNIDADLVVLSGCETGLGKLSDGDEFVGLTRAFIYAGTPSVVASLWKVEDRSTAALMASFYKNLKTMSKVKALRQAQLEMIRGEGSGGAELLAKRGVGGIGKLGSTPQVKSEPAGSASIPVSTSHPYFWAPFILVGDGKRASGKAMFFLLKKRILEGLH